MRRAFDLEKRQHLFSNNVIPPLTRTQVGIFGMGAVTDLGVDIQAAEDELERKWSKKGEVRGSKQGTDQPSLEFKGDTIGAGEKGKERIL